MKKLHKPFLSLQHKLSALALKTKERLNPERVSHRLTSRRVFQNEIRKFFSLLTLIIFALSLSSSFSLKLTTPKNEPTKYIELENIKKICRSIYLIKKQYYDPTRIQPQKMMEEGFYSLAQEVWEILPTFKKPGLILQLGTKKTEIPLNTISTLDDVLPIASQAFTFIKKNYTGKTTLEDMEYAFIGGMLSVLDPHSAVMSPKDYEDFQSKTEGEYGGLGFAVGMKEDGAIYVMEVFDNTPAMRAGIQSQDKILQIDSQSTMNMTLDEAVGLMRGTPKTSVTLKIQTADTEPRLLPLTRESIPSMMFLSKLVMQNNKPFAVIQIKSFQETTADDLTTTLDSFKKQAGQPLAGVVLDLRDDPGGLLTQAIQVSDKFLDQGEIVFTVGPNNSIESINKATADPSDELTPLIILIDQGSASASEIVAGALKNNNRAVVMGQRSFGKGSVQAMLSLRGGALKLTIQQYLTPGEESIQAVGIHPDIHLYPAAFDKEAYHLIENLDYSEAKLESHLDNTPLTKTSNAVYSLPFFFEVPDRETITFSKTVPDNDYPIQLALKLLDKMTGASKTTDLQNIKPVVDAEMQAQDQIIAENFKKRGIDWTNGPDARFPKLTLRQKIVDENGNLLTNFKAGSKVTLQLAAQNTGMEPLARLLVDLEAQNPLLNHQEFIFGKLEPGQERTAQVILDIPPTFSPFTEKVKLVPYVHEKALPSLTRQITTQFIEKERPRFAYAYTIVDGGLVGTEGNQNGIPESGEKVILRATVKNVGTVTSKKTVINIKNQEGTFVFLEKARQDVGVLDPNKSSTQDLLFHISPEFAAQEFKIEFSVVDNDTNSRLADTLVFSASDPAISTLKPDQFEEAPQIVLAPGIKQNQNNLLMSFTASDDTKLKDIAIFSNGKKLAYINLEDLGTIKTKVLQQNITLEKGLNAIVVEARDSRDLETQKSFVVVGE